MPDVTPAPFIMAFFGAAWAGLYWFSTDILAQWLSEKRVRGLYLKGNSEAALTHARQVIGKKTYRDVIKAWALFLVPTIPIFGSFVPLSASPYIYGGFVATVGVLAGIVGKRWMRNYRVGAGKRIIRFLLGRAKRDEIDGVLALTWKQEFAELRSVAVEGMGEWGSPVAVRLLEEGAEDSDPVLAEQAQRTLGVVQRRLAEARPFKVAGLPTLFDEFEHLTDEAEDLAALPEQAEKMLAKREEVRQRIEEVIASQMHLRTGFPDLFCMECLTRAEEMTHRDWRYVRCKTCKEPFDLQRGIVTVVGQIGPEMADRLENGTYFLRMWHPKDERTVPGEVDRIEVLPGGNFNYDWGVSAVVESMVNRFPNDDLKLPLAIDPSISLQTNTQAILKRIQASPSNLSTH